MSWEANPPDPTNPDLLEGMREFLIEQGVVRSPRDATHQTTLPPLWIEPRFGCPAPGQAEGLAVAEIAPLAAADGGTVIEGATVNGPGLVASIEAVPGIPPRPYEGFLRTNHIQVVIRSKHPQPALHLENVVRSLVNDKRAWFMGKSEVNESLLYRDLQLIGKDNLAFTYVEEYSFSLWGPFTPV